MLFKHDICMVVLLYLIDVFTKMPTIKELEINIDNYYNKEQQIKLLSILTKKFSI